MTVAKAIARAWTDADYKQRLLKDPRAALAEVGVELPANLTFKVVEDTPKLRHIVMPRLPDPEGRMSQRDLDKVAASWVDMDHCQVTSGW